MASLPRVRLDVFEDLGDAPLGLIGRIDLTAPVARRLGQRRAIAARWLRSIEPLQPSDLFPFLPDGPLRDIAERGRLVIPGLCLAVEHWVQRIGGAHRAVEACTHLDALEAAEDLLEALSSDLDSMHRSDRVRCDPGMPVHAPGGRFHVGGIPHLLRSGLPHLVCFASRADRWSGIEPQDVLAWGASNPRHSGMDCRDAVLAELDASLDAAMDRRHVGALSEIADLDGLYSIVGMWAEAGQGNSEADYALAERLNAWNGQQTLVTWRKDRARIHVVRDDIPRDAALRHEEDILRAHRRNFAALVRSGWNADRDSVGRPSPVEKRMSRAESTSSLLA